MATVRPHDLLHSCFHTVIAEPYRLHHRVSYLPSALPVPPFREDSLVLMAELVEAKTAAVANISVQILDVCSTAAVSGLLVGDSQCNAGEICVPAFANGRWDFTCNAPDLPTAASEAGSSASSGGNLGMIIGIILALIVVLLIAAFVYLRQETFVEEWDKSNGRTPTLHNPTYDSAVDDMTVVVDKTLIKGVSSAMYDWYKPKLSRRECTDYLMAQGEGAFVVRDSDSNPGWHMLGVKSSNRVVHDKIRLCDNGEYELLPSVGRAADVKQPTFSTLPDLVEHYLLNGEEAGLGYQIIDSNPIYDNHQLVQERTGTAVKMDYNDVPSVPEKRQYDSVPSAAPAGDGVSNPMYGRDAPAPPRLPDGYLDVSGDYEQI